MHHQDGPSQLAERIQLRLLTLFQKSFLRQEGVLGLRTLKHSNSCLQWV